MVTDLIVYHSDSLYILRSKLLTIEILARPVYALTIKDNRNVFAVVAEVVQCNARFRWAIQ